MKEFKGSMQHNAETIQRLSKMQYDTFGIKTKIIQLVCGVVSIYFGFALKSSIVTSSICLLIGCLLFTGMNMPAKYRADKIIKALNGNFPKTDYLFNNKGFTILAGDNETITYDKLIHLGEDDRYLYLYISRTSAYMIDKKSLSSCREAMDMISERTGKTWERARKLSYYTLPSIIGRKIKSKKQSNT